MGNRLLKFCSQYRTIYIYGAGQYGKKMLTVLTAYKVVVNGFIESNPEQTDYLSLPVFSIKQIQENEQSGIIVAIRNFDASYIQKQSKAGVLPLDAEQLLKEYFDVILGKLTWNYSLQQKHEDIEKTTISNILITHMQQRLGDMVCSTAFVRELKRNYSNAKIWLLIREQQYDLIKHCPYIDEVLVCRNGVDDNFNLEQIAYIEDAAKDFWLSNGVKENFDVAYLLHDMLVGPHEWSNLLFTLHSGAKTIKGYISNSSPEKRYYYEKLWARGITVQLYDKPRHVVENQLQLLRSDDCMIYDNKIELWPEKLACRIKNLLPDNSNPLSKKIIIALGLLASHPYKSWDMERYKALVENLTKKDDKYCVILLGDKDAEGYIEECAFPNNNVINLAGMLNKAELVSVMNECDLYVGPDTGLAHVATALDKPSVVMFASLKDSRVDFLYGPLKWGSRRNDSIILEPDEGLDKCRGICSMKYPHCINQITVETVEKAINDVVQMAGINSLDKGIR